MIEVFLPEGIHSLLILKFGVEEFGIWAEMASAAAFILHSPISITIFSNASLVSIAIAIT